MSARKFLWLGAAATAVAVIAVGIKSIRHEPKTASSATVASASAPANSRAAVPLDVAETVYDGKLATGWEDWGWGPHNLSGGPAKVVFAHYGGIIFRHRALDAEFGALSFRYQAPATWPDFLSVSLRSATASGDRLPTVTVQGRHVASLPDGWREVLIDLSELDPDRLPFDRIVIGARAKVDSDWVLLDKIVLVKSAAGGAASVPRRNVDLAIRCRAPSHPINPLIYGAAQGDWTSGQTAQRLGGNPNTRLNWDLSFANAGSDWFFENGPGTDVHQFVDIGAQHGATTALTVPIIGWVAKDAVSFGFPKSQFPEQRKFDTNRPGAGDGHRPDGALIAPGPPTQTSIAAPPELIGNWVRAVRERARGASSVQMYILDNEPSLWNETHRDVHPEPLGYDELLDRTLRYASAVRKADPHALIAGPAEWGYLGYLYSARDRMAGTGARPDRLAHGDVPLIPWYLARIAEHEKTTNEHLLDVLDVHFYPTPTGIYGQDARIDAEGRALRLRTTRALWDPSYVDESWINEPIRLIPRLKEWVAAYHPGLRISIGEWSFGADTDISGGLATAEALGRFGQQGLDAAFYWNGPKADTATFWAFRAFRNFDGQGAHFGDTSLTTTEANGVSLFASRSGNKIIAILLNRDANVAASTALRLDGCQRVISQRVFRFVAGSSGLQPEQPGEANDSRVSANLPPYSLTVLELDTAAR